MPISTTENRKVYAGDGTSTAFSFPYLFYADADLTVVLVSADGAETTKTLTTHYTVTGAGDSAGGTVTMLTAPASGETLVILREVALKQETDFVENDPLPVASIEEALDRAAMADQQLQEQINRSLVFPVSDDTSTYGNLPSAASRANNLLGFDEDGVPVAVAPAAQSASALQALLAASSGASLVGYANGGTTVTVAQALDLLYYGVVNPANEKYGAAMDGVTDDSAAFQAAAADLVAGQTFYANGTALLNGQVTITADDITLDLTHAKILNTIAIADEVWQGQTINPIFKINANNCKVIGGAFDDCVSQGIFAGGTEASRKSGFWATATRFDGLNVASGGGGSKCIQTRHVNNAHFRDIECNNIGHTQAGTYTQPLSINYSDTASIIGCTVDGAHEGGAANFLYVVDGVMNCNNFNDVSNPDGGQSCVGVHFKFSENIVFNGNKVRVLTSGQIVKVSDECENVEICGNEFTGTGSYTDAFSGLFLQGVVDFLVVGNKITVDGTRAIYTTSHTSGPSKKGKITGNIIIANTPTGVPQIQGSGIYINGGNTGDPREMIEVAGNTIFNGDIYVFQALYAVISHNTLFTSIDLKTTSESFGGGAVFSTSSQIMIENGSYNRVVGNTLLNMTATPAATRTGIRFLASSNCTLANNNVHFLSGTSSSYDYYLETSITGMVYSGNTSQNAANVNDTVGLWMLGEGSPTAQVKGTVQSTASVRAGFSFKDSGGTARGEIGLFGPSTGSSANIAWMNGSSEVRLATGGSTRVSINSSGHTTPAADNTQTLGGASNRWSVVYAGTGTINTSDGREKQQVRELLEAERRVALRLKGLIRAFKFSDAVNQKGDEARIHIGVIAQDVKTAFENEGLDGFKYALLCYDEWDDQPEVIDGDGRVVHEYRAAGNRYGVRYDELIAFVLAAL